MKIEPISIKLNSNKDIKPRFGKNFSKTLKEVNIGTLPCGIIGKIRVLKSNGQVVLLNLEKSVLSSMEIYRLKDNFDNEIGKIEFTIRKNSNLISSKNSNHVFVNELRNYSNPNTPYYKKGLDEYKQVGTRLIQIAQKRSYESSCNGNIELIAKNEDFVLNFYKKLGFVQPAQITRFDNPYRLHLKDDAKDFLANLYNGI